MKRLILLFIVLIFTLIPSGTIFSAEPNMGPPAPTQDLTNPDFTINVGNIYTTGVNAEGETSAQIRDWILGRIIQIMMLALGAIAGLIMIIGAGFMILHRGDDSMLTKGKEIFVGGIYAMIVALGSYYIVAAVRFLLYN